MKIIVPIRPVFDECGNGKRTDLFLLTEMYQTEQINPASWTVLLEEPQVAATCA